ncbi:hypothetical protein PIROE2DRAFT_1938 [Piromyces sp. E2]|nr:hypothetical protein PIROE2DRAFT_1938 [Piromyces sp. E2]|eukprot:OUM69996.1 hypothetical protein PIROE2DRAFT_1938 [Piromyces sp. E2]
MNKYESWSQENSHTFSFDKWTDDNKYEINIISKKMKRQKENFNNINTDDVKKINLKTNQSGGKYNEELVKMNANFKQSSNDTDNNVTTICIIIGFVIVVLLIIVIAIIRSMKKRKKNKLITAKLPTNTSDITSNNQRCSNNTVTINTNCSGIENIPQALNPSTSSNISQDNAIQLARQSTNSVLYPTNTSNGYQEFIDDDASKHVSAYSHICQIPMTDISLSQTTSCLPYTPIASPLQYTPPTFTEVRNKPSISSKSSKSQLLEEKQVYPESLNRINSSSSNQAPPTGDTAVTEYKTKLSKTDSVSIEDFNNNLQLWTNDNDKVTDKSCGKQPQTSDEQENIKRENVSLENNSKVGHFNDNIHLWMNGNDQQSKELALKQEINSKENINEIRNTKSVKSVISSESNEEIDSDFKNNLYLWTNGNVPGYGVAINKGKKSKHISNNHVERTKSLISSESNEEIDPAFKNNLNLWMSGNS